MQTGWRTAVLALLGALLLLLALRLLGEPQRRADDAGGESSATDDPEREARRPTPRLSPPIGRPLPRFVRTTATPAGPNTILADLTDDGSRKAGDALFEQQERDPTWAPRMEHHLSSRLHPAALARLDLAELALQTEAIDCRRFGCRITVSWSSDFLAGRGRDRLPSDGSPLRYLHEKTGPLAAALMRRSRQEGLDRRVRETFLLFYKEELREPDAWSAWPGPWLDPPRQPP